MSETINPAANPVPPSITERQQRTQVEEIVNVPVLVKAFGREKPYEIKRFSLGQFARSLNYINPLSALLQEWVRGRDMDKADWVPSIVAALSMSGDSILGLISVATYEPLEWLDDKDPFEGLELLAVIVEKNLDFFSEKNIKRVAGLVERITPKIHELYGVTSTTSSTTDTTTTQS